MPTLMDATENLLRSEHPAKELSVADMYIRQLNENPDQFVLPRKYAYLAPVIENFAADLDRFVTYIKAMRDDIGLRDGQRSERYTQLQTLSRRLDVRVAQHQRRERLRRAAAWFEKNYPDVSTEQRHAWLRKLELRWNKQRRAWLSSARKQRGGSLSLYEQRDVLDEFWSMVDEEISTGGLPPYE